MLENLRNASNAKLIVFMFADLIRFIPKENSNVFFNEKVKEMCVTCVGSTSFI